MKAIFNDRVIAKSDKTIEIEGNHYFPPDSVNMSYLDTSSTRTTCPWKGEACYYDLKVGNKEQKNAAWYYPEPSKKAKKIKDYVAFWKDVVTIKE